MSLDRFQVAHNFSEVILYEFTLTAEPKTLYGYMSAEEKERYDRLVLNMGFGRMDVVLSGGAAVTWRMGPDTLSPKAVITNVAGASTLVYTIPITNAVNRVLLSGSSSVTVILLGGR